MNEPARLTITSGSGWVVAGVSGEIDMSNVDDLGGELRRVFGAHPGTAVLDLTAVTYLDSAAVALLDDLAGGLRARRAVCVVAPRHGIAGRVLALSGLDAVVAVHDTVEDAVAAAGVELRPDPWQPT